MKDIIVGRSESDRKKYGRRGMVYLGKQYITMGQNTSLSNNVYLDVASSHVVFVCGKRGSGKCLTGDTKITLTDGRRVPIRDLERVDGDVVTLRDDQKLGAGQKTEFYKRTVNKTIEVTLRTGRTLELTPEHPVLTIHGWKPIEKLSEGSRIATPRHSDFFGNNPVPEHETKLLAYLIAEGHMGNKKVLFTNKDPALVEDFKAAATGFHDVLRVDPHGEHTYVVRGSVKLHKEITQRDKKGRIQSAEHGSGGNPLITYLKETELYGKYSHEKFIPKKLFTAPKNDVALFLNRLLSCDGSIHKAGKYYQITYSSSSERLVDDVQHLLLRFGVISRKRRKKTTHRDTYELTITSDFVYIYIQEIGFHGAKQHIEQDALRTVPHHKANPNTDTIPKGIWDQYTPKNWAEIGRKIGYKHPKALRESKRYNPSRNKLLKIAEADQQGRLKQVATSDIYWDEIKTIQERQEETTVYDITVPGTHNFVADDIIVHNSYTLGVVAEGVADLPEDVKQNLSIILVDTMGVYWTMKFENAEDEELLAEWGLKPKGLDVQIFTPTGYYDKYVEEGVPTDYAFSIRPSELSGRDWNVTFDVESASDIGVLIERVIHDLQEKRDTYSIQDIIDALENTDVEETTKNAAVNRFLNAADWGLFEEHASPLKDIAKPGEVSVLDVSCYATMPGSWKVKNLVVSLVADKLFKKRMEHRKQEEYHDVEKSSNPFTTEEKQKQDFPLVWLVIDEAHEFLPHEEDGKTLATDPLVTILREGRQPGISLILATQQPGKIHTDVMTQSDTVLSHRITAQRDTKALGDLMQSYMRTGLVEQLDRLPRQKGSAVIFDDTNEKLHPIRIRPRFTWHGGAAPKAIDEEKEE